MSIIGSNVIFYAIINLFANQLDEKQRAVVCQNYLNEMTAINLGQYMDLKLRLRDAVTEDDYKTIVSLKTGVLTRLIAKNQLGVVGADKQLHHEILTFSNKMNVIFQIRDDIVNLLPGKTADSKGIVGEDLSEGKITLMLIETMRKANEKDKEEFIHIVESKTRDQKVLDRGIELINKYGGIDFAKEVVAKEEKGLYESLDNMRKITSSTGLNCEAVDEFEDLHKWLQSRL